MTLPDLLHLATPLTIAALIAWAASRDCTCELCRPEDQP